MNIEIVKSVRAKRWRIAIKSGGKAVVTVPKKAKDNEIKKLVEEHREWITKHQKQEQKIEEKTAQIYQNYPDQIPFLGEWIDKSSQDTTKFYKTKSLEIFREYCDEITAKLNTNYKNIRVANQKTRWGSCSSKKTLSFNYNLIKAPRFVVYYLAVHECSHLIHPNHSKAFWECVASLAPDYKEAKAWLKANYHFLKYQP